MSNFINIKAAKLPQSSLSQLPLTSICVDYVNGFCRHGDQCRKCHEICEISSDTLEPGPVRCHPNYLSLEPRGTWRNEQYFEDDGPGALSTNGPRHDNDHVDIGDIKILPTADEILSTRLPYMPMKAEDSTHYLPLGQKRVMDVQFRHLRYENIEAIIDSCYHASQRLVRLVDEPQVADYDDRLVTPRGNRYVLCRLFSPSLCKNMSRKTQDFRIQPFSFFPLCAWRPKIATLTPISARYSLFRDIRFEELAFDYRKGVTVRLSFACPLALRGRRLGPSKHLEDGMLVVLVGLDYGKSLSTTFMEVSQRQTTEAMRKRTGNDLRGGFLTKWNPFFTDLLSVHCSIFRR